MIFTFDKNIIDIDIEKTKEFYEYAKEITAKCTCDGCCNYIKAVDLFPKAVHDFFDAINVDIRKAAEIIPYCSEHNGKSILYGGFYHICGRLLFNSNVWIPTNEKQINDFTYRMNQDVMYVIQEGYAIGFCDKYSLLEESFPMPAIQMEIEFHAPWVLDKENDY